MPTIKGPIHIKGGFNASKFAADQGVKIKPPFAATGWKSTKMPKGVDLSDIKLAGAKKDKVKSTPTRPKKDALGDLIKIKGIGLETVEDIKKIYGSMDDLLIALKKDKVPLRNDIVKKLKKVLCDK